MFRHSLTTPEAVACDLNMFRKLRSAGKRSRWGGERTRDLIFAKALELFRKRGFAVTTMKDIANAAGVATGAAYYYFESKETIVAAYYRQVQSLHAAKVREQLAGKEGLRERLASVVHVKLEILNDDREFLGALFRYTGEGTHSRCWKKHEDRTKAKRRAFAKRLATRSSPRSGRNCCPGVCGLPIWG